MLNHSVARAQALNRSLFQHVPNQIYTELILPLVTQSDLCATSTFERNLPGSMQSCLFDVHEHPWRDQLIQPHKAQFWWIRKQALGNTETTEKGHTVLHLTTTHYSTFPWRSRCTLSLGTLKWQKWGWCSQQYFKYCKFCVSLLQWEFWDCNFSLSTLWLLWGALHKETADGKRQEWLSLMKNQARYQFLSEKLYLHSKSP